MYIPRKNYWQRQKKLEKKDDLHQAELPLPAGKGGTQEDLIANTSYPNLRKYAQMSQAVIQDLFPDLEVCADHLVRNFPQKGGQETWSFEKQEVTLCSVPRSSCCKISK